MLKQLTASFRLATSIKNTITSTFDTRSFSLFFTWLDVASAEIYNFTFGYGLGFSASNKSCVTFVTSPSTLAFGSEVDEQLYDVHTDFLEYKS
ncbi:hypothetical protein T11_15695 [Trichinella zimbabwensis]|uniref:Uncharacterized protein n=1 Tax=Trichinella zimbabwensis TaxID=268475 RepID=A0A0V1I3T7_9BILA|nr:hypothetical protein T11_15695 [Trichinella zimbabwensis]